MAVVIIIDILAVGVLCTLAFTKGLEDALPFFTFVVLFLPLESTISLGFFELTTQRLMLVVLLLLYPFCRRVQEGLVPRQTLPLKSLILVHATWCLMSTALSIVPVMSVKKLVSIVFEYYVLYFIYWKTITKVQTINKILMAMVFAL